MLTLSEPALAYLNKQLSMTLIGRQRPSTAGSLSQGDIFFIKGSQSIIKRHIHSKDQELNMNNSRIADLPTCSHIISTMLTSAISFVSFAAFVANSLVTIAFLTNISLRTSTNYFIVNMAVSDLLSSATNWPLAGTEGLLSRKHTIGGSMAAFVCKLGMYSRAVSQTVSVESLLLIVVERYIAIVLPFKALRVSKRRRAALLVFTWICPVLVGLPYVQSSKIVHEGRRTFCRFTWSKRDLSIFYIVGFLVLYCVPLISIIILYSRIMKNLRQKRPGEEEQESARIRNLQQNRTVMKVFIWIVSAFFISWTPLCVYMVLKIVFPMLFAKEPCMLYLALFFYIFPPLNTVINPIILFVSSSRFSKALKEMLSCLKCKSSHCYNGGRLVEPQRDAIMLRDIR